MANMFEKYAADREVEQKKIEEAVVADAATDEKRTTLSLSLTVSDKKALKMRSLKEGKTIAAIIHEWIGEWKDEVMSNGEEGSKN